MPESSSKVTSRIIRSDIQALRTIAVTLVVLFHLWPNRVPGGFVGVDVFFVISGFLITKHILNEVTEKRFSISGFWARRIKRLLPASFLVLMATGIAIILLVPVSQWKQWFGEIQSSVFYFENWNLAGAAVDYLALSNQASPVQHFWSLSVEEQFYFFWPLIVAASLFFVSRLQRARKSPAIFAALLVVTCSSLAYGIYFTNFEPAIAYFSTPVRAWEFGVGALAVFHPGFKSLMVRRIGAALGLVAITVAALAINTSTPFPGTAALLPVLGTAAVILSFVEFGLLGKVFSLRPIQWIGDKSYSIYLWHWPILIISPFVIHGAPTFGTKLGLLALTLLLAWLTQKFVETRFSDSKPSKWKIFALAATVSVFIASMSGLATQMGDAQIKDSLQFGKTGTISSNPCFGAAARATEKQKCDNAQLLGPFPSIAIAPSDIPLLPDECFSVTREQVAASFCALGDRNGLTRIAAIGDSHIAHYAGALSVLALKNRWQIDLYAKGGCPFSFAVRVHDALLTKNCPRWVDNVVKAVNLEKYDAIITSQRAGVEWVGGEPKAVSGLASLWQELAAAGNNIVAIKDGPSPGFNVVSCLQEGKSCVFSRKTAMTFDPQVKASEVATQVSLINFDNIFCDAKTCFPIIGNAVVYRDDNHLTDTFARSLAPFMEQIISQAAEAKQ